MMNKKWLFTIPVFLFLFANNINASIIDSLPPVEIAPKEKKANKIKMVYDKIDGFFHDEEPKPGKAIALTFIIPGAGQVYNNKHWKVPIVYAGIGALTYAVMYNTRNYKEFKQAYIYRLDDDPNTVDIFEGIIDDEAVLKSNRDRFRNQLEQSYLGLAGFYILVAADAFVDAHLQGFDIDEDLSLKLKPSVEPLAYSGSYSIGIGLSFQIGK